MTVAGAGGPSPARCPREGRCGAEAPVARGSSGVLGPRRRGFPRVAVLRLAPLRCARSTRPPLGPLCDPGIRRRSVTSPHLDAVKPHLRAGERAAHADQRPCKRFWRTFTPLPHSRKGPALKGAQNGLERFREIPAPAEHLRSGRGRAAPPRNVTTLTQGNAALDLHRPSGRGLIVPAPPKERNPNGPAAAIQRRMSAGREGN